MQSWIRYLVAGAVLLLVGVIAWRLLAGSFKGDVQKICNAEKNAGIDAKLDLLKTEKWAKEHLDTPEAAVWFTELGKKGLVDRAEGLDAQAKKFGIGECPLVASYQALNATAEYRKDVFGLCSIPGLDVLDDDGRLKKMLDWTLGSSKSARMKAFADTLKQTVVSQRSNVVRAMANDATVYSCDLANVLERPQTQPKGDKPVVMLGTPQINGQLTVDRLTAALLPKMDDMNKCYVDGIARKADLAGKVLMKFGINVDGKVLRTTIEQQGTTLEDREVVKCLSLTVQSVTFPKSAGITNTVLWPMDLVPKAPMPQDPHGH